jgi:hypothetical protein
MKKLFLLLTGAAMVTSMAFAGMTPALTIARATKAIKPDGDASDWGTTWVNMTTNKSTGTSSAVTAKFQLTYNDSYLWLVAVSTGDASVDTNRVAITNSYERDCFEVFIKADTLTQWGNAGKYAEGDFQFREQRGSIYPDGFDDASSLGKNNADFKIGQVDAGSTFTQEWQFPWAGIIAVMKDSGSFSPTTVGYMKFEIQNADNTTGSASGRNQQLYWRNGSDNEWNNTTTFSLVKLADKVSVNTTASLSNLALVNTIGKEIRLTNVANNVVVTNIAGQVVVRSANVSKIDASSFAPGVYGVTADGKSLGKFVVR